MTETPSGLQFEDTQAGTGASPQNGQTCVMHYTGWLWVNGAKGAKFDSSVDRGRPFEFPIGQGRVIKGWDEGVASMKIGGKRTLLIPPALGYGERGFANMPRLLSICLEMVRDCPCDDGCPSCVGLPNLRPAIHSDPDLTPLLT